MHLRRCLDEMKLGGWFEAVQPKARVNQDGQYWPSTTYVDQRIQNLQATLRNTTPHLKYWELSAEISYWICVQKLYQAADLVGQDNLPYFKIPHPGAEAPEWTRFSKAVLYKSKRQSKNWVRKKPMNNT